MGQVTLYLDLETEERMRSAAGEAGVSLSSWVAGLIREKTAKEWPASVSELLGAWEDMPTRQELREGMGEDVPREPI